MLDPSTAPSPPTEQEVLLAIRTIARDELDIAREVVPDDDLVKDLRLDSMQRITLAVALDEYFGVKVTQDAAVHVRTIGDLVGLVIELARARA